MENEFIIFGMLASDLSGCNLFLINEEKFKEKETNEHLAEHRQQCKRVMKTDAGLHFKEINNNNNDDDDDDNESKPSRLQAPMQQRQQQNVVTTNNNRQTALE